jgi:serine/threonine protein phosphatase PrpC
LVDINANRPDHVYLSDFGLSKGSTTSLAVLTKAGTFLGTPGYSPPEQINGGVVDARTDQYALACAAFEILTGETPFQRDQPIAVLLAHLNEDPPLLSSRQMGLRAADPIFEKALAKSPERRYVSCGEFADALREALGLAPYYAETHAIQPTGHSASVRQPTEVGTETTEATQDATIPRGDTTASHRRPARAADDPVRAPKASGTALRYAVRSDVGLLMEGNEDSAYAGPRLLAVADGMGGIGRGDLASSAVIRSMATLDQKLMPKSELIEALSAAFTAARDRIRRTAQADPSRSAMSSSLTAMLWSGREAAIGHIGSSRAYLLRDGEFYQITRDHTVVQQLIDQGKISQGEAADHPQRSRLLRTLDGRASDPDLSMLLAESGDRFLLCSHGLHDVVSVEDILHALVVKEPADAVHRLIDLAIRNCGPDNVTCVVADLIDASASLLMPTTTPVMAGAAAHGRLFTPWLKSEEDNFKISADRINAQPKRNPVGPAVPRVHRPPPTSAAAFHQRFWTIVIGIGILDFIPWIFRLVPLYVPLIIIAAAIGVPAAMYMMLTPNQRARVRRARNRKRLGH